MSTYKNLLTFLLQNPDKKVCTTWGSGCLCFQLSEDEKIIIRYTSDWLGRSKETFKVEKEKMFCPHLPASNSVILNFVESKHPLQGKRQLDHLLESIDEIVSNYDSFDSKISFLIENYGF